MNSSQKISSILLAVAALAVSSQTFAARAIDAQRNDDRPSTSVSVADLDLSVPSDVQVAHQRVKDAASAVWTGYEVIIWGGQIPSGTGAYEPIGNGARVRL